MGATSHCPCPRRCRRSGRHPWHWRGRHSWRARRHPRDWGHRRYRGVQWGVDVSSGGPPAKASLPVAVFPGVGAPAAAAAAKAAAKAAKFGECPQRGGPRFGTSTGLRVGPRDPGSEAGGFASTHLGHLPPSPAGTVHTSLPLPVLYPRCRRLVRQDDSTRDPGCPAPATRPPRQGCSPAPCPEARWPGFWLYFRS